MADAVIPKQAEGSHDAAGEAMRAAREAGQDCLAAALEFLQRGWSVLPLCPPDHVGVGKDHAKTCASPGKRPLPKWAEFQERLPTEQEVRRFWRQFPNANLGVALGPVSGLVRVDVDGPAGESKLLEVSGGDLPQTLEFTSGRANGGRGLLYAIPQGVTLKTTPLRGNEPKTELRFQAKGAQTVVPPSRHPSGDRYQWVPGRGPGERQAALMPAWLVALMSVDAEAHARHAACPEGEAIVEGARNDQLTSLAGSMRRRGMSHAAIEAALLAENEARCSPPLGDAEVRTIATSVMRYAPGPAVAASQPAQPTPSEAAAYQIIWDHWEAEYEPQFRRDMTIYSGRLNCEVQRKDVCDAPGKELWEKLLFASDAPRWPDGAVKKDALIGFFKKWSPSVYKDLCASLPLETDAAEICEAAREQFREQLAKALLTFVTLGERLTRRDGQEVTETERRPLLDWCFRFAKPGPRWHSVRGYRIWAQLDPQTKRVRIAVSVRLLGQLSRSDRPGMSQRLFSMLAQRYDAGTLERAGGERCVELTQNFLESLRFQPSETGLQGEIGNVSAN